jgi:hypothetical protein
VVLDGTQGSHARAVEEADIGEVEVDIPAPVGEGVVDDVEQMGGGAGVEVSGCAQGRDLTVPTATEVHHPPPPT